MELSCGPPATTARHTQNDTTGASHVPPEAALRADHAPLRDGRPGSWSDWLGGTLACVLLKYPQWYPPGNSRVGGGPEPTALNERPRNDHTTSYGELSCTIVALKNGEWAAEGKPRLRYPTCFSRLTCAPQPPLPFRFTALEAHALANSKHEGLWIGGVVICNGSKALHVALCHLTDNRRNCLKDRRVG
jgi:hypothetical protein